MTAFPYYSNSHPRVAHNSWVQLAAECGFVAVGAYSALIVLTALSLYRTRKRIPLLQEEQRRTVRTLEGAFSGSLIGYLVCGFFLSMEDFEFFYLLVALVQSLDRVTAARLKKQPVEARIA
ncbi:MAG: hypothetical protein CME07_06050 [Gemmatimonadetes bacterium]|nr:hypothetical protein [Gemmatimonadota bacterium]